MKVSEIYSTYVTSEIHLFDSSETFMETYVDNASNIDMELLALYGDREFYNPLDSVDTFVYWKACWNGFVARNKHNFNRMWEDLNKDYDFDVLFSRDKTRTLDYLGSENEKVDYGSATSNTVLGEVPNDSASGSYKDVNKSTVTEGARTNNTTTSFSNREDKEVESTRGNTGVYTRTDLLDREYAFRVRNDFFIDIFSKFLGEVTYYE